MKYILVFFIAILLQSCVRERDRIKRKYLIENGTDREIRMDIYSVNRLIKSATHQGKGLIVEAFADDGGMNNPIGPVHAFKSDSVVITFGNNKRQTYYLFNGLKSVPENGTRNILDQSAYIFENIELLRFIVTEKDYEKAEEM